MRLVAAVSLAMVASACTSVRMEQRDGCWVKQTRAFPSTLKEEVGPCARPVPVWSEDRLTRLVQECVMHTDYRWQSSALVAWNRSEPLPERESEEKVLAACMARAETILNTEKGALEQRLSEVARERDTLKASIEKERNQHQAILTEQLTRHDASMERARNQMHESNNLLAEALGEAAKKPAPSAVATATSTSSSEGLANTQTDSTQRSDAALRGDVSSSARRSSSSQDTQTAPPPRVVKPIIDTTDDTPLMCELSPATKAKANQSRASSKKKRPGVRNASECTQMKPEPSFQPAEPEEAILATPAQQTAKAPIPLVPQDADAVK
ncbi:hypothetical protein QEG98_02625 [Myxococcus sp. MxC21-1]|uniref:hypothetical protein n=1 Tax=Myxococcus sp. MxC21-1 TaxID=3041439 RepID=UPI0029308D53|nr:hypothetical protein [Myxococcus sp. MxC21-1]WNZ62733.1 hypothetical protein QEG98_02625 [Myxococcus sp. MxC21-1]